MNVATWVRESKAGNAPNIRDVTITDPIRVLVNAGGGAVRPGEAKEMGIKPSIVFLRDDGWSLAAPPSLEEIAYRIWHDKWVGFQRKGEAMKPIGEYLVPPDVWKAGKRHATKLRHP
jgi:hypothetical protein